MYKGALLILILFLPISRVDKKKGKQNQTSYYQSWKTENINRPTLEDPVNITKNVGYRYLVSKYFWIDFQGINYPFVSIGFRSGK